MCVCAVVYSVLHLFCDFFFSQLWIVKCFFFFSFVIYLRCFQLSTHKLTPGGYLSFSVETLTAEDANNSTATGGTSASSVCVESSMTVTNTFKLRRSGRYGHTEQYIHRLCSDFGFNMVDKQAIVVRKETGVPIKGFNYLLQLKPPNVNLNLNPTIQSSSSSSSSGDGGGCDDEYHTMVKELSSLLGNVMDFIDVVRKSPHLFTVFLAIVYICSSIHIPPPPPLCLFSSLSLIFLTGSDYWNKHTHTHRSIVS